MAREFAPDFIFIDVDMADIDSKTACRALREDKETADITIVAISKKRKDKELKQLRKHGYAEALSKPLRSERLREAVEKHSS
jgi:CheY-like chemotaxis protein